MLLPVLLQQHRSHIIEDDDDDELYSARRQAPKWQHFIYVPKSTSMSKRLKQTKIPNSLSSPCAQTNNKYVSHSRMLVIAGQRVLLKLCFQVFIVLSSADEAGHAVCTRVRGWCAELMVSRVRVVGWSLMINYLVVRPRALLSRSNRLVAKVKCITARTASISGVQSSSSVVVFPPSRRDRSSSPVHTP